MLTDEVADRAEQFDRLKALSGRHTADEAPEVVEVTEQFEKCERMWGALKTGVDSLPAAIEPWKRLTTQHDELGYWFDEFEKRAGRDLEAVGEVQDDTTDICDHVYRLKVNFHERRIDVTETWCNLSLVDTPWGSVNCPD